MLTDSGAAGARRAELTQAVPAFCNPKRDPALARDDCGFGILCSLFGREPMEFAGANFFSLGEMLY